MSLLRYMLNDLRPLVRMLDEPLLTRPFPLSSQLVPRPRTQQPSDDPFSVFEQEFASLRDRTPALNMREEAGKYLVEAELPGVRKEDVDVSVEDGGRVLTIEGKVVRRGGEAAAPAEGAPEAAQPNTDSTAVTRSEDGASTSYYSSTFSRSISLPRPVAAEGVQAKMENGILSLTLPFMEDKAGRKISIE